MLYVLAALAFAIAAIIALAGIPGITAMTVLGIIAVGGALTALGLAFGPNPWWPGGPWRRVGP